MLPLTAASGKMFFMLGSAAAPNRLEWTRVSLILQMELQSVFIR